MIATENVGQPTIYTTDKTAEKITKIFRKPRVLFHWDSDEQVLHVQVPDGMPSQYVRGFENAHTLHLLKSRDAWFSPVPEQPYCLCILDDEPESLLLGFTVYDWADSLAPVVTRHKERANAVIALPNGQQRKVLLVVGAGR
jgi:hypothetical protein